MDRTEHSTLAYDPVLTRFRTALNALYGDRLERAVLFGSRARGEARPDSDYDVAVFLHAFTRPWPELEPLSEITTSILFDTAPSFRCCPFLPAATRSALS
jgi:uncharacterized protein